jgi:hypothetical protein
MSKKQHLHASSSTGVHSLSSVDFCPKDLPEKINIYDKKWQICKKNILFLRAIIKL